MAFSEHREDGELNPDRYCITLSLAPGACGRAASLQALLCADPSMVTSRAPGRYCCLYSRGGSASSELESSRVGAAWVNPSPVGDSPPRTEFLHGTKSYFGALQVVPQGDPLKQIVR